MWEKVEYVRMQPEHVRMRYVVGCLLVFMSFILGIWVLSLRESFTAATDDFSSGKAAIENSGGVPSLQNLFQGDTPLQVENKAAAPMTGEEYFLNQYNEAQQAPQSEQGASRGPLEGEGMSGGTP